MVPIADKICRTRSQTHFLSIISAHNSLYHFVPQFLVTFSLINFLPHFLALFSCLNLLPHFLVTISCLYFLPHFLASISCLIFLTRFLASFSCHNSSNKISLQNSWTSFLVVAEDDFCESILADYFFIENRVFFILQ